MNDWVRNLPKTGDICPCCGRFGRIYRRALNAGECIFLLKFARKTKQLNPPNGWIKILDHMPGETLFDSNLSHEYSQLAWWQLIEELPSDKINGNPPGLWRITKLGTEFCELRAMVLSHAIVFDGKLIRLDGNPITFKDALRKKFDYEELMAS
jgi:hypothetical protein